MQEQLKLTRPARQTVITILSAQLLALPSSVVSIKITALTKFNEYGLNSFSELKLT